MAASAAFLSSLLECTIFLLKRVQNSTERSRITVHENGPAVLLKDLFSRVWIETSNQKLKLEEMALAKPVSQTLLVLMDLNRIFFDAAWEALAAQMKISSQSGKKDEAKLVSVLLKALVDGPSDSTTRPKNKKCLKEKADELLKVIFKDNMERIERLVLGSAEEGTTSFDMMEEILDQLREGLFIDQDLAFVRGISFLSNRYLMAILIEMGWLTF
jgi:hypothetical protein